MYQRNQHGPAENIVHSSQAMQNGTGHENNDVSPSLPVNAQNTIESDLSSTLIQKASPPGLASDATPLSMAMRLDMFDPTVSSGMPTQHLHETVSNAENMPSHPQPQVCLSRPKDGTCDFPVNTLNEQEELAFESGSVGISSAYSQGLVSLTSSH